MTSILEAVEAGAAGDGAAGVGAAACGAPCGVAAGDATGGFWPVHCSTSAPAAPAAAEPGPVHGWFQSSRISLTRVTIIFRPETTQPSADSRLFLMSPENS